MRSARERAEMADGRWWMEDGNAETLKAEPDGRWRMTDDRWRIADGKWKMAGLTAVKE
jgi:hypothetical protein